MFQKAADVTPNLCKLSPAGHHYLVDDRGVELRSEYGVIEGYGTRLFARLLV